MTEGSEKRKKAMDLFLAYNTRQDFFTAQLYRLIMKADGLNTARLAQAFPVEVSLYQEWMATEDQKDFFERYQIGELLHGDSKSMYQRLHGAAAETE